MGTLKHKEFFLQGVEKIKALGYKCFQPISNYEMTYCKITDGTHIGYMQLGQFGYSFNFGTVSKYGYQYRIINPNETNRSFQYDFGLEDMTKEAIELSFRQYPNWTTIDKSEVVPWKNWEEYTTKSLDAKLYKGFVEL